MKFRAIASTLMLALIIAACGTTQQGQTVTPNEVTNHPEVLVTHLKGDVNTKEEDFGLEQGSNALFTYLTSSRSSGVGRQDLYRDQVSIAQMRSGSYGNFTNIAE